MEKFFHENEIMEILDDFWEEIALFAYQHFRSYGRGLIVLMRGDNEEETNMAYITLDPTKGHVDKEVEKLVDAYDPDWEIVVQYQAAEDSFRTMRMRTAEGVRNPKRIWFFEEILTL
jgi:hypothetical protein